MTTSKQNKVLVKFKPALLYTKKVTDLTVQCNKHTNTLHINPATVAAYHANISLRLTQQPPWQQ
jgi:hypothetical protein